MKINIALKIRAKNGILQKFIDDRGWTQSDFAREIGVVPTTIGRWFNLKDYPKDEKIIIKISNLVGKLPEEIFPPPLMKKDWLTGIKQTTIYKDIDVDLISMQGLKMLPAPDKSPEEETISKNFVAKLLSKISGKELEIIQMRFGLNGEREYSRDEVAEKFGVSNMRIYQTEQTAFRRMREKYYNEKKAVRRMRETYCNEKKAG